MTGFAQVFAQGFPFDRNTAGIADGASNEMRVGPAGLAQHAVCVGIIATRQTPRGVSDTDHFLRQIQDDVFLS